MAQRIPLPLTVSCFSKIQIGFTFLAPARPGSPGQRAVKRVCVCVHDACEFFCRLRNWSYVYIFYSPKLVVQTRIIYENKVKKGKKSLAIVLDNDTAYLTHYTYFPGIFILCDKGCLIISMGVNGWMFLLVPDHPGQVFPDKGPLNGCVCLTLCGFSDMAWLFLLVYWLHLQCSQNSDFSASNK